MYFLLTIISCRFLYQLRKHVTLYIYGIFQLPDVTFALYNITVLMESNIVSEVSQGRDSFLKIQKDIQHAVNQTIPVVSASIRRACNFLADIANNMTAIIDRINVDIDKVYIRHLEVARNNIDQYSPYRFVINVYIVKNCTYISG